MSKCYSDNDSCVISVFCFVMCFFYLFLHLSLREWFLNGNYLIMIVSVLIILPLAMMKQLGMFSILLSHFLSFFLIPHTLSCNSMSPLPVFLLCLHSYAVLPESINHSATCYYHCNTGYLGYTSGFSLSCMVFFLISVSLNC